MRRWRALLVAALVAGSAASGGPAVAADLSFWDGRWAPAQSPWVCDNRRGDPTDRLPLEIRLRGSPPAVRSYEHHCTVKKITSIIAMDAVIINVSCGVEGAAFDERRVLMMNDRSRITVYDQNDGITDAGGPGGRTRQYTRCD